ncbi:MAG: hypothetical protein U9P50_02865 [Patescibacteria group bacterium]|nr:hypothetical protein [Patescibacteria group bacterium]
MDKKFWLFLAVVGSFFLLIFGCGGGGDGGGGGSTPTPTPEEPAYLIEHQGDVFQVPSWTDNLTMRIVVKDKARQVVPNMLVRVVFSEFWAGELEADVRVQELRTNTEGICIFQVPRYDSEGERTATISLPDFPEITAVSMTIKYVIDTSIPTRVMVADSSQAEISLSLGESVDVAFVVLNAWGNPISGIETQIVIGQEYITNDYRVTDGNGRATFFFTAGPVAGSTVFRIQIIDYPAVMAEVIINWTGSTASSIEILNPSKWEGDVPVVQTYVGSSTDVLFVVKDNNGLPASGVMVLVTYPALASDVTDVDGLATFTIPASLSAGWDPDKIWVVGNDSIFLEFKIEYLD